MEGGQEWSAEGVEGKREKALVLVGLLGLVECVYGSLLILC